MLVRLGRLSLLMSVFWFLVFLSCLFLVDLSGGDSRKTKMRENFLAKKLV